MNSKLTPWVKDDKFKNKVYADNRTGAIPKSTYPNYILEGIYRERNAITRDKQLDDGIDHLKQLGLLKDNKVRERK